MRPPAFGTSGTSWPPRAVWSQHEDSNQLTFLKPFHPWSFCSSHVLRFTSRLVASIVSLDELMWRRE